MLCPLERPSIKVREGPPQRVQPLVSACAFIETRHDPPFKILVSFSKPEPKFTVQTTSLDSLRNIPDLSVAFPALSSGFTREHTEWFRFPLGYT